MTDESADKPDRIEKLDEKPFVLKLSRRDAEVFLNALENPPEPNERLRKAFELYRRHVVSDSKTDVLQWASSLRADRS